MVSIFFSESDSAKIQELTSSFFIKELGMWQQHTNLRPRRTARVGSPFLPLPYFYSNKTFSFPSLSIPLHCSHLLLSLLSRDGTLLSRPRATSRFHHEGKSTEWIIRFMPLFCFACFVSCIVYDFAMWFGLFFYDLARFQIQSQIFCWFGYAF